MGGVENEFLRQFQHRGRPLAGAHRPVKHAQTRHLNSDEAGPKSAPVEPRILDV
jgi:hypothetical protein